MGIIRLYFIITLCGRSIYAFYRPCKIFGRSDTDWWYAYIVRNFTSSNNDGVLIYHMLFSSVFSTFSLCI